MSFAKADQLLELVTMMAARRAGITLADVEERFAISRRTAQRMMRNVEARHPEIEIRENDDGTRRWLMRGGQLRDFLTLTAGELAALDLAMGHLTHAGQIIEAKCLRGLKEKIIALVPSPKAARLDTDYDALLEAQGFVARPGPRPHIDEDMAETVAEALKACRIVEVTYQGAKDAEPRRRTLAAYGLLSGLRRYLVARPEDDPTGPVRTYRMDAIHTARLTDRSFVRPPDFDLQAFANRAFGLFQSEQEYGEVVWRFSPQAAAHARGYLFHPGQTIEDQPDGSLVVRFMAAGHLEMCWYLYAWGDRVEVLKPEPLRTMVAGFRRPDFPALP